MEFNKNYITEQIKRYVEVFNEDIAAKERELSNLNNAVSALENIHRTLKDANFQNDMASVCERIGKEKTIKEKELEEFRKSIRIEFRVDQLILPNDTINSEEDWFEKNRLTLEELQKIRLYSYMELNSKPFTDEQIKEAARLQNRRYADKKFNG